MGDCLVCGRGIVFYNSANNKMDLLYNKKEIVMAQLIDKFALVAEIERRIELLTNEKSQEGASQIDKLSLGGRITELQEVKTFINTLEVKEVDLELITGWFDHIAQIADDRMTLTNQRMTDAHALDEIKCLAKNSSEFITKHYKAQKGE